MTTAIIGAGIAGLSAARALAASGEPVTLFDKGRGPGGRMSTRRAETPLGEVRWDHGAQFFTARSSGFQSVIVALRDAGALAAWHPGLADIRRRAASWTVGVRPSDPSRENVFVGTPSMNAVIKALAADQQVHWGRRVTGITMTGRQKVLIFEDGSQEGPYDTVVSALPAEQAVALLQEVSPELALEAGQAVTAPCWAVMLAYDAPIPVSWDCANVSGGALSWIARNSSKPGRGDVESWVLHASPDWSREHVDLPPDAVIDILAGEFREMTGAGSPVFAAAHRWLYAKVDRAARSPFGWDDAKRIATIGDWRSGPRVEAAWNSGEAFAAFFADVSEQLEM